MTTVRREIWEEEKVVLRSSLWSHDCESDPEWFTEVARRESGETGGMECRGQWLGSEKGGSGTWLPKIRLYPV